MSILTGYLPTALDSEGRTLPNARLYSYLVGTYTPKDTYSNTGLTIPNSNPVVADGSGVFTNIYLGAGGYKLELRDQYDVVIETQDNYYSNLTGADLANINADIAATQQQLSQTFGVYDDSGVADAYVLSPGGVITAPTAYANDMIIGFTPAHANTGASTVNVSGLGVKNLVTSTGAALPANYLVPGTVYQFVYALGQFYGYFHSGQLQANDVPNGLITNAMLAGSIDYTKLANQTAHKMNGYNSGGVATLLSNPLRLLADTAATVTGSISFVLSTLDGTQDVRNTYLIKVLGIQPASNDVGLYLTLSSDGGSTYESTNYDFVLNGLDTGATRTTTAVAAAQITVAGTPAAVGKALSNGANEVASLDIWINNINTNTSVCPMIDWTAVYYNADSQMTRMSGGASRSTAADYDAIKFTWEGGGNFAAVGRIMVYKLCNSLA